MRKLLVKPGLQKNGQTVTVEDLRQVAANFNPDAPSPITLGHPVDSRTPAFGRVESVVLTDRGLEGEVSYTPELTALERQGYYRGWSVGLKPGADGWYLHHLAMCGECPPASEIRNLSVPDIILTDIIPTNKPKDGIMTPEEVKKLIEEETKPYKDKITALEAQVAATKQKEKEAEGKGGKPPSKAKDDEKSKDGEGKEEKGKAGAEESEGRTSKELSDVMNLLKKERLQRLKEAAEAKGLGKDQIDRLTAMVESTGDISLADANNPFDQAMRFITSLPAPRKKGMTAPVELSDKAGEPFDYNGLAAKM